MSSKALFNAEETDNLGKHPKAAQKSSGNDEFLASTFWLHIKQLQMSGFKDFFNLFAVKTDYKMMLLRLGSLKFIPPKK